MKLALSAACLVATMIANSATAEDTFPKTHDSKPSSRSRPTVAPPAKELLPLELPASHMTFADACGLMAITFNFVQANSPGGPLCGMDDVRDTCESLKALADAPSQLLTDNDRRTLARAVPKILAKTYGCIKKIRAPNLSSFVRRRELLIEKKKSVIEAGCKGIIALAKGGRAPGDRPTPSRPHDYVNACRNLISGNEARLEACLDSGKDLCEIAVGKIKFENLIPSDLYDASVSKHLPVQADAYIEGALDGATQVLRDLGADKLNDFVTKKVVARGGYPATVALATITAAAKQINDAAVTGDNAWGKCLGSPDLGVCLHQLFAGGLPESQPVATQRTVGDHEEIDCCRCRMDLYEKSWMGSTPLGSEEHISPIESGDFSKSLCHALDGQEVTKAAVTTAAGNPVFFRFQSCRKVTVRLTANVKGCHFPPTYQNDRNIQVVADPIAGAGTMHRETVPTSAPAPSALAPEASPFHELYAPTKDQAPRPVSTPVAAAPTEPLFDVCTCSREWSSPVRQNGYFLAYPLCVLRLTGGAVGTLPVFMNDVDCRAGCDQLRKWDVGAKACRVPARQAAGAAAKPPSPVFATPQSPPPLASNACSCEKEVSRLFAGRTWFLCVARRDGQEIARTYASPTDRDCSATCDSLRDNDRCRNP